MIAIPPDGRIALVDDDDLDRMVIDRVVKMSDLTNSTVEFGSGDSFIDYLTDVGDGGKADGLSLVLMDINMPGMTGFEALAHIRNDLGLTDLPVVVMLTSSDAEADIRKAEELGAQAYLAKQAGLADFVAIMNDTFTNEVAA
jgi:CheY-like chemotaxis protein